MRYRLDSLAIQLFKATWPCHGLPDNLDSLVFEFEPNGSLVDIEATSDTGQLLDSTTFDGPALLALSCEAPLYGMGC